MSRTRMSGVVVGSLLAIVSSLGLVACSGDSDDAGSSKTPVTIHIDEKDGKITPVGDVVKVDKGQTINLLVTTDVDDEIHVHSDPEHEYEVKAGDTDRKLSFAIDTPGTWVVESHGLEVTLVKLQVS